MRFEAKRVAQIWRHRPKCTCEEWPNELRSADATSSGPLGHRWHADLYTPYLYARVPREEHGAPSVFQAAGFLDCARTLHWTPTGGAVYWCMPASAAPASGACRSFALRFGSGQHHPTRSMEL